MDRREVEGGPTSLEWPGAFEFEMLSEVALSEVAMTAVWWSAWEVE